MPTTDQPPPSISPAELQEIVRVFADSDLRELRVSVGAVDLVVSRNEQVEVTAGPVAPTPVQRTPAPVSEGPTVVPPSELQAAPERAPVAEAVADAAPPGVVELRSPALGTFYRRPAPDQAPFVEVGSQVAVGDAVGSIEVMKMFTTVTADVAGTITEICVDDAVLVEHGQRLFYVDPAGS